jgi:Xaa-Pro aminopeptidase
MSLAPGATLASRHARVRASLDAYRIDALIVTSLPNIFYLTNFTGSGAILVLTSARLYFITDFRYVSAVESAFASAAGCPEATVVRADGSYDEALVDVLGQAAPHRLGYEWAKVPVSRYQWWRQALSATDAQTNAGSSDAGADGTPPVLVPTERLIERERLRKDAGEVATLREAARRLSGVVAGAIDEVRVGRSEREIAAAIDWLMRRAGFERPAFQTIVASGPNGALPHARAGERRLEAGDLTVLDFGGVYDGYCVDLTRTVSLGPPGREQRRVYDAVVEAEAAAIAAVRPGVSATAVDAAARGGLERHGLADAFGHGTGHGLGIEVHEEPWLSRSRGPAAAKAGDGGDRRGAVTPTPRDETITEGMVFTIEPGAYLPGAFGVRIEDDVLVVAGGCEVLTDAPRDLVVR